jgi:hypothetical protein
VGPIPPIAIFGLSEKLEVALIAAGAALLGAVLGAPLRYVVDRLLQKHKLESEYDLVQIKQLHELVGRFRGRLVEAADLFHYRMCVLYDDPTLLERGSAPRGTERYYFHSTVLRFLVLMSLALRFEREAFFIEPDHAKKDEIAFLWYCKGIRRVMTDPKLFDGIEGYKRDEAEDHFFTDELRDVCKRIEQGDRPERGLAGFVAIARQPELSRATEFFTGIGPHEEDRYRWDRLVALHLMTMSFLDAFGYEQQKDRPQTEKTEQARERQRRMERAAREMRHPLVRRNLAEMIGDLGLRKKAEALLAVLDAPTASNAPAARV